MISTFRRFASLILMVAAFGCVLAPTAAADVTVNVSPANVPDAAPGTQYTFTFTADDPTATFRCTISGAASTACTSPVTVTTPGVPFTTASLIVQPTIGGNVNAPTGAPVTREWRILHPQDRPSYLSGSVKTGKIAADSTTKAMSDHATFFWSLIPRDTNGMTFPSHECRLDGAVRACPLAAGSGFYVMKLKVGTHTFTLTATDANGVTTVDTLSWTVVPLVGTNRKDTLVAYALGGTIRGLGGPDLISGSQFADVVYGDAGKDGISTYKGNDTIYGGDDRDTITPGPGKDVVFGGAGNDDIRAQDGERDIINCGPGTKDFVEADKIDRTIGCEIVIRAAR